MSEKKYCCVPETYKTLSIYNAGTIGRETIISEIEPSSKFKYCIDEFDKIKTFFFNRQENVNSIDTEDYLKYKMTQSIKSIFRVSEISDVKLYLDSDARFEFTVFYDTNGIPLSVSELYNKNIRNTIVGHRYTFNLYQRYNKEAGI